VNPDAVTGKSIPESQLPERFGSSDYEVLLVANKYQTGFDQSLLCANSWLLETRQSVAQGNCTAKAIDYSMKRWEAFGRYAKSGNLPIDNNSVENSIRPIAIGKKNWLFAGSERAGRRVAAIQILIGMAKLNDIDPHQQSIFRRAWTAACVIKVARFAKSVVTRK
jgi:hypothetical protein